jgi:hypothetical protein
VESSFIWNTRKKKEALTSNCIVRKREGEEEGEMTMGGRGLSVNLLNISFLLF